MNIFTKHPSAVKDYVFDFSNWLAPGETISTKTVTGTGVTIDSSTIVDKTVVVWISGGTDGVNGVATCLITTSGSRTEVRTLQFRLDNTI